MAFAVSVPFKSKLVLSSLSVTVAVKPLAKLQMIHILRIDTGELVLQSLHSWMRMLRGSGFSKQEVQQLCDDAKNLLDQAHASNDDAAKRQKSALDSVRQIQDEINSIFSEK